MLLLVSVISVISAFAKTVKEAQTSVMPLMVVVMLVGVTGCSAAAPAGGRLLFLIPIYNSVQSMVGIFVQRFGHEHSDHRAGKFAAFRAFGLALTRMFNSEKIMFEQVTAFRAAINKAAFAALLRFA